MYASHFGALLAWSLIAVSTLLAAESEKITYSDHILPIFRNSCLNCHNPEKQKAGLDLSTYQATMAGNEGGKVIELGNADNSLLFKVISHAEEPAMPPRSDKLPDSQIELVKKWIEQSAPENSGSKVAVKLSETRVVAAADEEKPDSPPPMPCDLLLEPVVRTQRAGAVISMAASPRAPLVAIAGQKQVLLYNTGSFELEGVLPFPEGFPEVVRFSRDGKLVLAGGGISAKWGRVVAWDVQTGERVAEVGDEFDAVLAADISRDHEIIALGSPGKLVKLFSARDGRLLHSIKKHTDWVTAISFSSDGKLLVTGDRAGNVYVWEAGKARELFTLAGHKAAITGIASVANIVATVSEDGTLKLWDLKEGKQLKSWEAHKGGTLSVAFAPDGRIVSSGRDKVAKLWDQTGKQLRVSEAVGDVALQAAFSNGQIIAGDWTGAIRVWSAVDGKRISEWTPNPPTLAERANAVAKRLSELQPVHEKLAADRAQLEKAMQTAGAEARAAEALVVDREARLETVRTQRAAAEKAFEVTSAAREKAGLGFAQLKIATKNASEPDEAGDAELAEPNDPTEPKAALDEVRQTADHARTTADEARVKLAAAESDFTTQESELDAAKKSLPEKTAAAKAAADAFEKIRIESDKIARELAAAKREAARWRAAQVNVALHNARQEIAMRQSVFDKAVADAKVSSAELDMVRAELAAAEKLQSEAPERIKAKEAAIAQAQRSVDTANEAVTAVKASVGKKEALLQLALDFSQKLAAELAQAADDKTLAVATKQANAAFDSVKQDLENARKLAAVRDDDLKRATESRIVAEQALADMKRQIADAPQAIEKLRRSVKEIAAKTAPARALADKAVAAANEQLGAARAQIEALRSEFESLKRDAVATEGAAVNVVLQQR